MEKYFISIVLLLFCFFVTEDLSATEINFQGINMEEQDALNELGKVWVQIDNSLGDEQLKKDLIYFHNYALDESKISGEEVSEIILAQARDEQHNNKLRGSLIPTYGQGKYKLPKYTKGHMFYVPGSMHSGFVGHVGIYTNNNKIVQAWIGTTLKPVSVSSRETYQYSQGKILGQPGIKSKEINEAVTFAESRKGRPYDLKFSNNKKYSKDQDKAYNCSELVWKAWNFTGKASGKEYYYSRDLDGDGGSSVFPGDIYHSKYTKVVGKF